MILIIIKRMIFVLKYDKFMVREVNPSVMDKAEKLSGNISI